jgi:alkanesulfonate monooxygenase SsuD/methylene tetrahydromethanopterin reductase-like flavin-dependent oxidoreductase (luciferase family)
MRYGISVPNFGEYHDPRFLAKLAWEAEEEGWDGFFVWDHIKGETPFGDPTVALAAIATNTERIRSGPPRA